MTPVLWRRAWRAGFLVAVCALADPASAPYFGRNKVRYDTPAFRVLVTDHFDVYYDPAERRPADEAARLAERWYTRLAGLSITSCAAASR